MIHMYLAPIINDRHVTRLRRIRLTWSALHVGCLVLRSRTSPEIEMSREAQLCRDNKGIKSVNVADQFR